MHFGVALTMVPQIGIGGYDALGVSIGEILDISVGTIYIVMSLICLLLQIIIEKKKFKLKELFQLIFVFGSGAFVDLFLNLGLKDVLIENYMLKLLIFALAVVIKAIGIMIIMETFFIRIPLEGLCFVICKNKKTLTLGRMRMIFDILFLAITAIFVVTFNLPWSIGVGTILAILIQGPTMDLLKKPIDKIYLKLKI